MIGICILLFVVYFIISMKLNNPFEFLNRTHENDLIDNFILSNNKGKFL